MITNMPQIKKLLRDSRRKLDKVGKAHWGIEPYYGYVDAIVDCIVKKKVNERQFKHFEACKFKVKALWYIKNKIEEWDNKYFKFVLLCIKERNFSYFHKLSSNAGYEYEYFPFFEALEFENILSQGKACFDTFSKAIGSYFGECPNNLEALEKVLSHNIKKRDKDAEKILGLICHAEKLKGIILDPKIAGKKSIRDLTSHQERINIKFLIRKGSDGKFVYKGQGALLEMRHKQMVMLPNYLIKNIATDIWYYTLNTINKAFMGIFQNR